MFSIDLYTQRMERLLKEKFGERLMYMGLQGSYLRGEATDTSDIDIVVVLDRLEICDMDAYREVVREAGDEERSCGFICGKEELAVWNPMEIGQLLRETKDIHGKLADLVPEYTRRDEICFLKMSLNNLFHALCHRYIHAGWEKSARRLAGDYKSAFFIIQQMHFLETGKFCMTKADLERALTGDDREIMETERTMRQGGECDMPEAFKRLYDWCRAAMIRADRL